MSKLIRVRCPYDGATRVLVATPTYAGHLSAAYQASMLASVWAAVDANIAVDHVTLSYDCHVDDARNALLREFMAGEWSDLVFIDADIGWEPASFIRLVKHDADVVAGVYPKKGDDNWPVFEWPGRGLAVRPDGLVDVPGVPTGFMRIRRHVVEKLIEANAHRQFHGQSSEPGSPMFTIVFERTWENGVRWSGDYAFCRAWAKLGGKVFVDPEMKFEHVGETSWAGCLGDFWRKRANIDHPKLPAGIKALREGRAEYDVFDGLFDAWDSPYAAPPALLAVAYSVASQASGPVLETGSGLSTIVMGIAAEKAGVILHALEHDLDYFKRTAAALQRYGLKNVQLHYAPLRPYTAGFVWYELPEGLPDEFAVVLCDGPQQRFGRHGLFKLLGSGIAHAHLIMDDAKGPQLAHLDEWAKESGRSVSVLDLVEVTRPFAVSPAPERMAAE